MSDFEKKWRERCHEKGYTDAQCDRVEGVLNTVGRFVTFAAFTGVACTGASVVSLCTWSSKPIPATYRWCKKQFYPR